MNGLKYWDPEESTRTKWETTYASELQDRGLSQDFTGLSTLLLGQAQPAQFQSAEQTGYWWESKVSDDGSWTELDNVANNANAEMPRSYYRASDSYGTWYNWYAATAESGTIQTPNDVDADDSLCPRGWQLPKVQGNYPTFSKLFNAYELSNDTASAKATRQSPLFFTNAGYYYDMTGYSSEIGYFGYYWESTSYRLTNARDLVIRPTSYNTVMNSVKTVGLSVRCVQK